MRFFYLILLSAILCSRSSGQDITGLWEGKLGRDYGLIVLVKHNGNYIGYTYDEDNGTGFCKCNFIGVFDSTTKKLKGRNEGFIAKKGLHSQSSYNLQYSKKGNVEFLEGELLERTMAARILTLGIGTGVYYTRVSKEVDTTAFMQAFINRQADIAEELASVTAKREDMILPASTTVAPPVAIPDIITEKNKRRDDTLSVIDTKSNRLTIRLVDNGVVDGDTVSILHNGKIIAERIGVTAKPFEFVIDANAGQGVQQITLVAHNLGSISPNTALVMIDTGEQQYRLTASTDLTKNAVLVFRYRE